MYYLKSFHIFLKFSKSKYIYNGCSNVCPNKRINFWLALEIMPQNLVSILLYTERWGSCFRFFLETARDVIFFVYISGNILTKFEDYSSVLNGKH